MQIKLVCTNAQPTPEGHLNVVMVAMARNPDGSEVTENQSISAGNPQASITLIAEQGSGLHSAFKEGQSYTIDFTETSDPNYYEVKATEAQAESAPVPQTPPESTPVVDPSLASATTGDPVAPA